MIRKILNVLTLLPLLIVGGLTVALIYSDRYSITFNKVLAAVGVFAIFYWLYKFTLFLDNKLKEYYKEKEILECDIQSTDKKFVMVYGGAFQYGASLAMNKYVKELIDSNIEVLTINNKDLYFETNKVKVQFVTKEMEWIGRRCDEAFGFSDLTSAYLTRNFRTYGWTGSLVDYILIQENS